MRVTLQNVGTRSRLDVAPEATAAEDTTLKTAVAARPLEPVTSKPDPATIVTLSDAAHAGEATTQTTRNPNDGILYNYEIELARDPTAAITKFTLAIIQIHKDQLAKLESDEEIINLLTGKAVTPEIREKLRESALRGIKDNEAVLQEHLFIAAGGNPAGDKAKAAAALDTLAAPQNVAAPEISNFADIKAPAPVKALASAASKSNAVTSAALLIDLLTKGNEAYRAAVKRGGVIPS